MDNWVENYGLRTKLRCAPNERDSIKSPEVSLLSSIALVSRSIRHCRKPADSSTLTSEQCTFNLESCPSKSGLVRSSTPTINRVFPLNRHIIRNPTRTLTLIHRHPRPRHHLLCHRLCQINLNICLS